MGLQKEEETCDIATLLQRYGGCLGEVWKKEGMGGWRILMWMAWLGIFDGHRYGYFLPSYFLAYLWLVMREIDKDQTYDGGISESSENESHAGYAYCAVAALSLLSRPNSEDSSSKPTDVILDGIPDIPALVKFLTYRQFAYVDPPEDEDEDEDNFHDVSIAEMEMEDLCVGYNGRCNKVADTCYCWWVGGALDVGFDLSNPATHLLPYSPFVSSLPLLFTSLRKRNLC
jgi:hypothetical protein